MVVGTCSSSGDDVVVVNPIEPVTSVALAVPGCPSRSRFARVGPTGRAAR